MRENRLLVREKGGDDLKGRGLPYDVEDKGWTSFSAGKVVLVDVGSLQLKKGNQVISWTTPPENPIRFVQKDRVRGALYVRKQGVFYTCGLMVTVR